MSDLELLLLCECARLNVVIVRTVREERGFDHAVFVVRKYAFPAEDVPETSLIAIRADPGRSAVRVALRTVGMLDASRAAAASASIAACLGGCIRIDERFRGRSCNRPEHP